MRRGQLRSRACAQRHALLFSRTLPQELELTIRPQAVCRACPRTRDFFDDHWAWFGVAIGCAHILGARHRATAAHRQVCHVAVPACPRKCVTRHVVKMHTFNTRSAHGQHTVNTRSTRSDAHGAVARAEHDAATRRCFVGPQASRWRATAQRAAAALIAIPCPLRHGCER